MVRNQRLYGLHSERLIATTNNLAAVLERQGDELGAEEFARTTLELTRTRNLAQEIDPDNLNIGHLNRLAHILWREGELTRAEETAREAIRLHATWTKDPHFSISP